MTKTLGQIAYEAHNEYDMWSWAGLTSYAQTRYENTAKAVAAHVMAAATELVQRPCTCHPDDNPPKPCPKNYALTDCRAADHIATVSKMVSPPAVAVEPMRSALQSIVLANPRTWQELAEPTSQFELWAKSIARAALELHTAPTQPEPTNAMIAERDK